MMYPIHQSILLPIAPTCLCWQSSRSADNTRGPFRGSRRATHFAESRLVPPYDYYRSPECQNRIDPILEDLYLRAVIKPLYRFIRDQGYESVDGKFVRRERDHGRIIGYDDINQLFWYPEDIARIVLTDKVRQSSLWLRPISG